MSTTVKKYTEIYQQIKQDIESGVYKVNEKIAARPAFSSKISGK